MQKISDSTSTANEAGEFTEGNPAAGVASTLIKATWLNAIQRELVALVLGAGIQLNKDDDTQVLEAVRALAGADVDFSRITNLPTTLSGYKIADAYTKSQLDNLFSAKAPIGSPTFTGVPRGPTAAMGTATTQLATTAFVDAGLYPKAPLASPGFTGIPSGPTAVAGTKTTQLATTAFVNGEVSAKAPLASPEFTGVPRGPTAAMGTATTQLATTAFVDAGLYPKAPLASPGFTGIPSGPTAVAGTNTTQLATTAFVNGEVSAKAPLASPALTGVPTAPRAPGGAITTQIANTAFVQAAIDAIDPWAMQPIGVPIAVFDHIGGMSQPPTASAFRYIKLTASDSYNAGVLSSESVTGTAPLVHATALINLLGSPINGQAVRLINTERRGLRAGNSGAVQDDQFQGHTFGNGAEMMRAAPSGVSTGGEFVRLTSGGALVIMSDTVNGAPRYGNETRTRNIGATYYMRIK